MKGDPQPIWVHFFKPSGKWCTSEQISYYQILQEHPTEALKRCLREAIQGRLQDMTAIVVDEPAPFPMMLKRWGEDR